MTSWRDWIGTVQWMDCLKGMKQMPDGCVHGIVTDPPYGLGFMSKEWDKGVPGIPFWQEALRIAMPGAYLLAFGGTRTFHRLACAIEDAGWEIRDTIMWVYGSGFPKSHDVSKAIDKAAGVKPIDLGVSPNWRESKRDREKNGSMEVRGKNAGRITAPATEPARHWQGWGTALKPAWEPIIVARKPLEGTVAENVLKHGTGAMNIDGCRVGIESRLNPEAGFIRRGRTDEEVFGQADKNKPDTPPHRVIGRWPANLIHDGSEEVVRGFPVTKSGAIDTSRQKKSIWGGKSNRTGIFEASSGSAARFFYCAKASRAERNAGLNQDLSPKTKHGHHLSGGEMKKLPPDKNAHPTVKPLKLMEYLVKLISRDDQIILDMFAGSGSTLVACKRLGRRFIGFEKDRQDALICNKRLQHTQRLAQGVLELKAE